MDMVNRAVAMAVMVMTLGMVANAAVHKVGDSAGWTTIGNVDYKLWAATKTFDLGDIIKFEYNSQFHNVMKVTHSMYKSCNASDPLETYTTGNDSITIRTRGHHYYMCGVPGHCQAGQKVDINVPRTSVAPTPSALATPVPAENTPAPSPNHAASFHAFKCHYFGMLGLAVLSFFCF